MTSTKGTKKKKFSYKTWEQSRTEIEKTLDSGLWDSFDNELSLSYGVHHKHTLSHFPSPVFSAVYREGTKKGLEYYVVNYVAGETGESIISQWRFSPTDASSKVIKKVPIRQCLKLLVWIPNQRAFIGYCSDMTLRGYTGVKFEEKSRLTVHSTILCMLYVEEFDELITAGQGYLFSWIVRMISFGLLVDIKDPPLRSEVNSSREWVIRLLYDKATKSVMALTDVTVYVISMVSRQQIDAMHNTHKASLTSCAFYRPYLYYISAARDGTIHIYHTGVQALIRTFSAHRDGVTGVLTLPQLPILISWSHTSGSIRMWRLDTLELTNETTLSENIHSLQLVRNDRLFYLSECDVRIFDINVLYSIFTTLTSPAESFKVCTIRRSKSQSRPSKPHKKYQPKKRKRSRSDRTRTDTTPRELRMLSFSNASDDTENISQTLDSSSTNISVSFESNATNLVPSTFSDIEERVSDDEEENDDSSFLDQRLICILDNRCIMGVSPISGIVLNVIYPSLTTDKAPLCLDVESNGYFYYVAMTDGKLIEFNCMDNPATVAAVTTPDKDMLMRVCSVLSMELYVDEGSRVGMRRQGIFTGLENGNISLHDGGEKMEIKRDYERGGRRKGNRKRKSSLNKFGPVLTMSSTKAHLGRVTLLYAPCEGSLSMKHSDIENQQEVEMAVYNILMSCGTDQQVIIWRVSIVPGASPLKLEVLFHKLRCLPMEGCPTCLAVAANVALFGFNKGNIEMCKLSWKSFVSTQGARIKLECTSIVLHSFMKISLGRELLHKAMVTCASESLLLSLFLTTSKDKTLKIWDCDGQLVRELLLGEVVASACFIGGRDILACMRAHIVRVEAQRYLPTEYLLKILQFDRAGAINNIEPEEPKPMEGATESLYFFIKPEDSISEIPLAPASETEGSVVKFHPEETKQLNEILKYLKKRKTFITVALQAMKKTKNEENTVCGLFLKDAIPVEKPQDAAAKFVAALDPKVIAKYAVAPDGYIPNSVVRSSVKTVYRQPAFPFIRRKSEEKRKADEMLPLPTEEDIESLFSQQSEDDRSSSCSNESSINSDFSFQTLKRQSVVREIELKEYLKGRRREGTMDPVIKERKRPSTRRRKKTLETQEEKEDVKVSAARRTTLKEREKEPYKPPPDKLINLLEVLSRQVWCPSIATLDNFNDVLSEIAEVIAGASGKSAPEICKFLCLLWDACRGKSAKAAYNRYFSVTVQRKLFESLQDVLFHVLPSVQKAAIELLCRFDNVILKDIIMSAIMPKFIRRIPHTPLMTFQNKEDVISIAARAVKFMSVELDIGQVHKLSRMASVNEHRGTKYNEVKCMSGLSNALLKSGVDIIDVTVWSTFILPLLSKKPQEVPQREIQPSDVLQLSPDSSEESVSKLSSKQSLAIPENEDQLKISHLPSETEIICFEPKEKSETSLAISEPPVTKPSVLRVKESDQFSSAETLSIHGSVIQIHKEGDEIADENSSVSESRTSVSSKLSSTISKSSSRLFDSRSSQELRRKESLQIFRKLRRSQLSVKSDQNFVRAMEKRKDVLRRPNAFSNQRFIDDRRRVTFSSRLISLSTASAVKNDVACSDSEISSQSVITKPSSPASSFIEIAVSSLKESESHIEVKEDASSKTTTPSTSLLSAHDNALHSAHDNVEDISLDHEDLHDSAPPSSHVFDSQQDLPSSDQLSTYQNSISPTPSDTSKAAVREQDEAVKSPQLSRENSPTQFQKSSQDYVALLRKRTSSFRPQKDRKSSNRQSVESSHMALYALRSRLRRNTSKFSSISSDSSSQYSSIHKIIGHSYGSRIIKASPSRIKEKNASSSSSEESSHDSSHQKSCRSPIFLPTRNTSSSLFTIEQSKTPSSDVASPEKLWKDNAPFLSPDLSQIVSGESIYEKTSPLSSRSQLEKSDSVSTPLKETNVSAARISGFTPNLPSTSSASAPTAQQSEDIVTKEFQAVNVNDFNPCDWREIVAILQQLRRREQKLKKADKHPKKSIALSPKPPPHQSSITLFSYGKGDSEFLIKFNSGSEPKRLESVESARKRSINFAALKKQLVKYGGSAPRNATKPTLPLNSICLKKIPTRNDVYEWKLPTYPVNSVISPGLV